MPTSVQTYDEQRAALHYALLRRAAGSRGDKLTAEDINALRDIASKYKASGPDKNAEDDDAGQDWDRSLPEQSRNRLDVRPRPYTSNPEAHPAEFADDEKFTDLLQTLRAQRAEHLTDLLTRCVQASLAKSLRELTDPAHSWFADRDVDDLRLLLAGQDPPPRDPPADRHSAHADFYAALWNLTTPWGVAVPEASVRAANAELTSSAWAVNFSERRQWEATPAAARGRVTVYGRPWLGGELTLRADPRPYEAFAEGTAELPDYAEVCAQYLARVSPERGRDVLAEVEAYRTFVPPASRALIDWFLEDYRGAHACRL